MLSYKHSRQAPSEKESRSVSRLPRSRTADDVEGRSSHSHNRHKECIKKAEHDREERKPVEMNSRSQILATHNGVKPIQDRAKQILEARNYRLQLQRQHRQQKQREIEDMHMKRERNVEKVRRLHTQKPAKIKEQLRDSHISNLRRHEEELQLMREKQLLKMVIMREEQLESTLIARLRQLSPYSRRSIYAVEDFLDTGRFNRSENPYSLAEEMAFNSPGKLHRTYHQRHRSPLFGTTDKPNDREPRHSPPPATTAKKPSKKPSDLRKLLELNKSEIMGFLTEILQRQAR